MARSYVRCRYCQIKIRIPDCKPDRLIRVTLEVLTAKKWLYYGKRQGCCPDCNLFTPLNEIGDAFLKEAQ